MTYPLRITTSERAVTVRPPPTFCLIVGAVGIPDGKRLEAVLVAAKPNGTHFETIFVARPSADLDDDGGEILDDL
jgi:hypothetical protein